ncbi:MAG: 2-oxoacid:acceptor oxidoreductase family protein, partial [Brevinematia bacterium]
IPPKREDINIFKIEANDLAINLGDIRFVNMIMLGALFGIKEIYEFQYLLKGIEIFFKEKNKDKFILPNQKAAEEGYNYFKNNR